MELVFVVVVEDMEVMEETLIVLKVEAVEVDMEVMEEQADGIVEVVEVDMVEQEE